MPKSLHTQIEELETQLAGSSTTGEENDQSSQSTGTGGGRADEDGEEQRGRQRSGGGGDASQGDDEASSEDGETSRQSGRRASRDGRQSRGDAGGTDGSADGAGAAGDDAAGNVDGSEDMSPQAFAKLRRELKEATRNAQTLREEKEAAERQRAAAPPVKPEEQKAEENPDPEPAKDTPEHDKWQIRQLAKQVAALSQTEATRTQQAEADKMIKGAVEEFNRVREEYMQENPDYEPAFHHAYNQYAQLMRLEHPEWTNQQIVNDIDWKMLQIASKADREGKNACQVLYDYAVKTAGYKPGTGMPKAAEEGNDDAGADEPVQRREAPRRNLEVVSNNRRKSATGLGSGGQGGGAARFTKDSIKNMTNAEISALSPEEFAELERVTSVG